MADLNFNESIEEFTTSTPGHADEFNKRQKKLLENDAYLKEKVEKNESHLADNVQQFTNVNSSIASSNNNIKDLKQYTTTKSGKDVNGIYVTYQRNRLDGTLLMKSVLSGGTSPQYTTRTETWYDADGKTVATTKVYTITYDNDGDVVSEV